MAVQIHHTLHKKALKFGITLEVEENEVTAYRGGKLVVSGIPAKTVLEQAIARVATGAEPARISKPRPGKKAEPMENGHMESGEDEDEDEHSEEGSGRSIVKRKYKKRYKPHGMCCGTELSKQITSFLSVKDEDGRSRISRERLIGFAKANGCWDPLYAGKNTGMVSMDVRSRLYGNIRRDGATVIWKY